MGKEREGISFFFIVSCFKTKSKTIILKVVKVEFVQLKKSHFNSTLQRNAIGFIDFKLARE